MGGAREGPALDREPCRHCTAEIAQHRQHRRSGGDRLREVTRSEYGCGVCDEHGRIVTASRSVVGNERNHGIVVDEGAVEVPGALGVDGDERHHRLPHRRAARSHECVHLGIRTAQRHRAVVATGDTHTAVTDVHACHIDGMADFHEVRGKHRGEILDDTA